MNDIRWKQRFNNYQKAFQNLSAAVDLAQQRPLSDLEQQGLIQSFEFTHELAWNVLKDFLEEEGFTDIIGSKSATRKSFERGLIANGQAWMDMIRDRNLSSHTYNMQTAQDIVHHILDQFYPAFKAMAEDFHKRADLDSAQP